MSNYQPKSLLAAQFVNRADAIREAIEVRDDLTSFEIFEGIRIAEKLEAMAEWQDEQIAEGVSA